MKQISILSMVLGLGNVAFAEAPDIVAALDLPVRAQEARDAGIEEAAVDEALKAAKEKKLKAKDSAELLGAASDAAKEHGNTDNFGSFVKSKLEEGLRGKDLAAAIKAEHVANGKGKAKGKDGEHGKSGEHGKPDDKGKDGEHGKAGEHGKPDAADGQPEGKGKPDGKGKPENKGKH